MGSDASSARELDDPRHTSNETWHSLELTGIELCPTGHREGKEGSTMVHGHQEAVDVARLFTAAVEKAMAANTLGHISSSGERHRARHEAVAQFLLDHILKQDDELERLLDVVGVRTSHEPVLYNEWVDRETDSRFDHVIDDTAAETYRSVLVIEDKIDAQLAPGQLDRYCAFLASEGGETKVLVLHPAHNPLKAERSRAAELEAKYAGVSVQFMTWTLLSQRMVEANPDGAHAHLWRALAEYAETVGTGDLANLPSAGSLDDPAVAQELRDLFLTMQNVAAIVGSGRSRQVRFSFHGGNIGPWLQMSMTDSKQTRLGLELDVEGSPGTLYIGSPWLRSPQGYSRTPSKIGVSPEGKLSAAAQRRVEEIAQLSADVRDDPDRFPDELGGRPSGKTLSDEGQDALTLLGAIFQAQAIKNPHRGGAPSRRTRGVNEGDGNERLGAVLVRDDDDVTRSIALFIGPPAGQAWERCTIWLRDDQGEREIETRAGESGREYVLRVWETARFALGW